MKKMIAVGAAIAASPALAGGLEANNEVQFDLNSIVVQALDAGGAAVAFGGLSHTGSLAFSLDADSGLAVFIDGSGFPSLNRGGPAGSFSLSGGIDLNNGVVTGGSITISIDGGADTYSTSIRNGSGTVKVEANQGANSFSIDGLTFNGMFSDGLFGNIDVTDFVALQPFGGNFINFDFAPDANGRAGDADLDVFTIIPLPHPAALAGFGLAGIVVARRRR